MGADLTAREGLEDLLDRLEDFFDPKRSDKRQDREIAAELAKLAMIVIPLLKAIYEKHFSQQLDPVQPTGRQAVYTPLLITPKKDQRKELAAVQAELGLELPALGKRLWAVIGKLREREYVDSGVPGYDEVKDRLLVPLLLLVGVSWPSSAQVLTLCKIFAEDHESVYKAAAAVLGVMGQIALTEVEKIDLKVLEKSDAPRAKELGKLLADLRAQVPKT